MTQRQEIIERLNGLELEGGSHESLSAIAKAIYEPAGGWTLNNCDHLRRFLVVLISRNSYEYDRGFDEGFASADDVLAENEAALEAHGFYRWPYKPGDDVEHDDGRRGVVRRVCLIKHEDGTTIKNILVKFDGDKLPRWIRDSSLHPYHKPTVEDVLTEFVERWHDTHHDDIPALKAEYAAKLRLADDGKEQ